MPELPNFEDSLIENDSTEIIADKERHLSIKSKSKVISINLTSGSQDSKHQSSSFQTRNEKNEDNDIYADFRHVEAENSLLSLHSLELASSLYN